MSRVFKYWLLVALTIGIGQASVSAQSGSPATTSSPSESAPTKAPDALAATNGEARVTLSWRSVEGATGYHLFRALNGVWEPRPVASVVETTYTIGGALVGDTAYAYAVAAFNGGGTGPYAMVLGSVTPAAATPELGATVFMAPANTAAPVADAPVAVSAPAGPTTSAGAAARPGPQAPAATTATLLPFVPAARPSATPAQPAAAPETRAASTSAPAAGAPVQAATATTATPADVTAASIPTAPAPAAPSPATAPSPAVTGAAPATSARTVAETVSPAAAPPPPATAPTALVAAASDGRVVLTWQPVTSVTGYFVYRAINGVWTQTPIAVISATSYTNSSLTNGTTYSYRVAAYNTDGGAGPSSANVTAVPMAAPRGLKGEPGDTQVTLSWQATAGATSYIVFRSTSDVDSTFVAIASNVTTLTFTDTSLANDQRYYYRVRGVAGGSTSDLSSKIFVTPVTTPPTAAPTSLVAAPGNARVVLTWDAVPGATSYRIFRTTTGVFDRQWIASVTTPTFTNTSLVNGTAYAYRVVGRNSGGDGPLSSIVTATPTLPPAAPGAVKATAGDRQILLRWASSTGALTYNVYRGTTTNGQATTPVATGITASEFTDVVDNGPSYFYKVTALNGGGESPRSPEVNAAAEGAATLVDAATQDAYRLLQQATWGPTLAEVERVKQIGAATFVNEQLSLSPSIYPDTLLTQSLEMSQEHFMQLALTGDDQLRQRVAWALHKIWVVSAVEVPSTRAILTYYRLLMGGAFGNYRDLMKAVTLNPAMGRYLNMLNNQSQQATGFPPNENFARELMQLFTLGLNRLNPDGSTVVDGNGAPVAAYTEQDVVELARMLTGWTFGDGDPATVPRQPARENYGVPMEAVPALHDYGPKVFLGQSIPGGQTPQQDLEQALDILFAHPNVAPFIGRQLIQQLVMSNPSPGYVAAVSAAFETGGVRGDLATVVRTILLHTEAGSQQASAGKLSEPVLFVVAPLRAFGAAVTDYPFMSDLAEMLGQRIFYPPSVFSYFSPGYRVRGTAVGNGQPLGGPEFMILTSVTALERANYIGYLLSGRYGTNVTIDYAQFTARAADPATLVDYCNLVFMGGRMTANEREVVVAAVRAAATNTNVTERVRTAIYLSLVMAQSQVDR